MESKEKEHVPDSDNNSVKEDSTAFDDNGSQIHKEYPGIIFFIRF